ncbi:MAG: four helix bundle protein [Prolixibacteraceae bacterium]|nr:four helix bundle protein [Prolixibacteraceae bacterium]
MKLDELEIYQIAMRISDIVWFSVLEWNSLAKDTMGKQLIRSSDSIAANIAEGFGRFHFKDRRQFMYYSRGSLYETKTWLTKAVNRNIIPNEFFNEIQLELEALGIKLNNFISVINKKTQ